MKSLPMSLLSGIVVCAALSGCGDPHSGAKMGGAKGPPEVYVSTPVKREIIDFEEFPGRLEADRTVQVRARVTGYLLPFSDKEPFGFKEGGTVKKGQLLFKIDPQLYEAELAFAKGKLLEAQGQFDQARADLQRIQRLRVPTEISAEDVNRFRAGYVTSEGRLEQARADLKKAEVNMAYTEVRAPISGDISKSMVDPGNLVVADNTILTSIGSSQPRIKASFDVDERTLTHIVDLMKKDVIPRDPTGTRVDMWLADQTDKDEPLEGKIDFADKYVDTATGTLRVRGEFDNPENLLVPGMFVRVRLYIGKAKEQLLIAEKALVTDQGQKFIYVLKNEDTSKHEAEVDYRRVEIGRLHEGLRVIKNDALKPGEKVVVTGLQRLQQKGKVAYKEVPMPVATVAETASAPAKAPAPATNPPKASPTPPAVVPPANPRHGKPEGKKHSR